MGPFSLCGEVTPMHKTLAAAVAACALAACGQTQTPPPAATETGAPHAPAAAAERSPDQVHTAIAAAAPSPPPAATVTSARSVPTRAAERSPGQAAAAAPSPPPAATETSAPPAPATAAALSPAQTAIAALPAPFSAGNYENGRRSFAQCRVCHAITAGGGNGVGPNLHGVFGRTSGAAPAFNYSAAMRNAQLTWDAATLDRFLTSPRAVVPGTAMIAGVVTNGTQRRDLIAYLAAESQH